MTIKVKMYCPGIKIDMNGEIMDIPEGATVGDAVRESMERSDLSDEVLSGSYMVNGDAATLNTVLCEDAVLTVIKVLNGG